MSLEFYFTYAMQISLRSVNTLLNYIPIYIYIYIYENYNRIILKNKSKIKKFLQTECA